MSLVIPRDLFNHAKILKCLGQLYLKTEHMSNMVMRLDDQAIENAETHFDIYQFYSDGSLGVQSIDVLLNGELLHLRTPLNSRDPYPLYLTNHNGEHDDIFVFTDDGELSPEFKQYLTRRIIQ